MSEDIKKLFSLYMAENEFLRKLDLHCWFSRDVKCLALNPILQAVSSGNGSLNELEITDEDADESGEVVEEEWALTVQMHLVSNLNHHRHRSGQLLENLTRAATIKTRQLTVVKALASIV